MSRMRIDIVSLVSLLTSQARPMSPCFRTAPDIERAMIGYTASGNERLVFLRVR